MNTQKQARALLSPLVFVGIQCILVASVCYAAASRYNRLNEMPRLPQLRSNPVEVLPEFDYPAIVSDEQLRTTRQKLRPRLRSEKPKINYVDHALRFWGRGATFDDPECLSGAEMEAILTDHAAFKQAWGTTTHPFLIKTDLGVAVRTQEGNATASHVDHTLATLAECGLTLEHPMVTSEGTVVLRDLLEHALLDFSLNQNEYEWTTLASALYAASSQPWYSKEGQQISFDQLASRLMRQEMTQGVCFGNHRIYTLTLLLRIDQQIPLFVHDQTRPEVIEYLLDVTRRLVQNQSVEGWWDKNWHNENASAEDANMNPQGRRLLATGHALEWWAMAPEQLHPPRETLVRAGQWLVREIDMMSDEAIDKNYTFLTHVGRALSLWRKQVQ